MISISMPIAPSYSLKPRHHGFLLRKESKISVKDSHWIALNRADFGEFPPKGQFRAFYHWKMI